MPRPLFSALAAAAGLALSAGPVAAEAIEGRFVEGAPTDRFEIRNAATCPLDAARITIDLVGSAGSLYFDVTGSGAGLQVFQPFRLGAGSDLVTSVRPIEDGDRSAELEVRGLPPGASVDFTIDVDDEAPQSARGQTQISGSEIEGAALRARLADGTELSAIFGPDAVARLELPACAPTG
ncbi:MAG: aggregation factor core [Pseudomonadota bacterium]